jgi:hypothetical protein
MRCCREVTLTVPMHKSLHTETGDRSRGMRRDRSGWQFRGQREFGREPSLQDHKLKPRPFSRGQPLYRIAQNGLVHWPKLNLIGVLDPDGESQAEADAKRPVSYRHAR